MYNLYREFRKITFENLKIPPTRSAMLKESIQKRTQNSKRNFQLVWLDLFFELLIGNKLIRLRTYPFGWKKVQKSICFITRSLWRWSRWKSTNYTNKNTKDSSRLIWFTFPVILGLYALVTPYRAKEDDEGRTALFDFLNFFDCFALFYEEIALGREQGIIIKSSLQSQTETIIRAFQWYYEENTIFGSAPAYVQYKSLK